MGISNDWQILSGLAYSTISDTEATYSNNYIPTESSVQTIADAIGWEVVRLSDYAEHLIYDDYQYDAAHIYIIRPPEDNSDETNYNFGILLFSKLHYLSGSSTMREGHIFVNIATGRVITYFTCSRGNYCQLLRPTTLCTCIRYGSYNIFLDKFYNPKTEKTKWGACNTDNSVFADLYTGTVFTPVSFSNTVTRFSFGGFVSLKKVTEISTAGVYKAQSLYRFILDYNSVEKTIELSGATYINVSGGKFYIRLAD